MKTVKRGAGGCNTFSTHYQVQDGRLSFGPVASTKIACATNIMQEEQRFFDALGSADGFELSAAESDDYIVRALAGQTLSVDLSFTEGRAILIIWGQDGNVLISDHADDFSGLLSSMDKMTIRV